MFRWMVISVIVALGSVSVAQAQNRGQVLWTVSGAGAGFGVGLWAGLSAFDDAVNSDRKVWTSAIVGAGIGAVAGYLIGRSRSSHSQPSTTTNVMKTSRQMAEERQSLEHLAKSFRFDGGHDSSPKPLWKDTREPASNMAYGSNRIPAWHRSPQKWTPTQPCNLQLFR